MKVDYLIIGQGLCGTFLSWNLLKEGRRVIVIDESRPFSSTKVASGVINPITGRRMVKTWMIDELLPFAKRAYEQLGAETGVQLAKQADTLLFHPTLQMRDAFEARYSSDKEYVGKANNAAWNEYFNFHYGIGTITPCLHIDLTIMLNAWRQQLKERGMLIE
jgi:glycine/D-amino acid oxidase-like deaminating enzyme